MIRTAEFVTPKHPDKMCDQISDAILDECLRQDPDSRVAVETMGGHGIITVTGEITTKAFVDIRQIVNRICPGYGVQVNIVQQSPEIAQGVDQGGAGDQGIMVGFACNETPELMPLEYVLARSLCKHIYESYPYDGKVQVTLNNGKLTTVVTSFQNVTHDVLSKLVWTWLKINNLDPINVYLNPAGDWNQGGFEADTGVTGRKIVIDAYGPRVPVGGGAFSGKDATKVDRSGAYIARALAVKALNDTTKEVYCYLAYVIGKTEPIQVSLIIDGIETTTNPSNLTPEYIIDYLDLKKPQFEETAKWGHFGNGFLWG